MTVAAFLAQWPLSAPLRVSFFVPDASPCTNAGAGAAAAAVAGERSFQPLLIECGIAGLRGSKWCWRVYSSHLIHQDSPAGGQRQLQV